MSDELNFKFPFANRFWMIVETKSSGDLKLHLDAGNFKCRKTGKLINLWGSLETVKDHSKFNLHLGANCFN